MWFHRPGGDIKLVGLAEAAVKESASRIQAALRNGGYRWRAMSCWASWPWTGVCGPCAGR